MMRAAFSVLVALGVVSAASESQAVNLTSVMSEARCGGDWRVSFQQGFSLLAPVQLNAGTGDFSLAIRQIGRNNYGAQIVLDSRFRGNFYSRQFHGDGFTLYRPGDAITRPFTSGTANPAVVGSTATFTWMGRSCLVSVTAFLANVPSGPPTPTPVPIPAKPLRLSFTHGVTNNTLTPTGDANGNLVRTGVYNFGMTATWLNPAYSGTQVRFVLQCADGWLSSWPQNLSIGSDFNQYYTLGGGTQSIGGRWTPCATTMTAKVWAERYDARGPGYGERLSDQISVTALGSLTGTSYTYVMTAFSAAKNDVMNVAGAAGRFVAATQGYVNSTSLFADYCVPRRPTAAGSFYLLAKSGLPNGGVDRFMVPAAVTAGLLQSGYVREGTVGYGADNPAGTIPLKLFLNGATGDVVALPDTTQLYGSSSAINAARSMGYHEVGEFARVYDATYCLRSFEG